MADVEAHLIDCSARKNAGPCIAPTHKADTPMLLVERAGDALTKYKLMKAPQSVATW